VTNPHNPRRANEGASRESTSIPSICVYFFNTHNFYAGCTEIALEGCQRVKEQLKKISLFEYYQTSFSSVDTEPMLDSFIGVPEEGACGLITQDPLLP
jgi:hypothetical protein